MTPQLKAGYIKDTLLDPHAANNAVPGQQYSLTSGPLGWLAKGEIDSFQSKAKDPAVFIPARVNDAEVFYQHTLASQVPRRQQRDLQPVGPGAGQGAGPLLQPDGRRRHPRGQYRRLRVVRELRGAHPGRPGPVDPVAPARWPGRSRRGRPQRSSATGHEPASVRWARSRSFTTTRSSSREPPLPARRFGSMSARRQHPSKIASAGHTTTDAAGRWTLTTHPLPPAITEPLSCPSPAPRHAPRFAVIPTFPWEGLSSRIVGSALKPIRTRPHSGPCKKGVGQFINTSRFSFFHPNSPFV